MADEEAGGGDEGSGEFGTGTLIGTGETDLFGSGTAGDGGYIPIPFPASDPFAEPLFPNGLDPLEQFSTTTIGESPVEEIDRLNRELAAATALEDQQQADLQQYVANYLAANPPISEALSGADAFNVATEIAGTLGDNADLLGSAVAQVVSDQLSGISGDLPDANQTGQNAVADPVVPFSGQLVLEADDLRIDGAGIDLIFHRTYKSQVLYSGPLGANWNHSYNVRLREGDDSVWLTTGDLREEAYTRHPLFGVPEFTYFVPPDGRHAVIVPVADSFARRLPDGTRYIMERSPSGNDRHRLRRIEDRFGNFLDFAYVDDLLTDVVVNQSQRIVTFDYDEGRRLIAVSDWTGRTWRYGYDDSNNLIAVTTPPTDSYPAGLTTQYEYDVVGKPGFLQHNLIRITDAAGRECLANEYGTTAGLKSFNSVVRQRQGSGDARFEYEAVDEEFVEVYTEAQRPAVQTNYIDRNGHPVHLVYNAVGNLLLKEEMVVEGDQLRHLVWRYRYNQDGGTIATLSPEGVLTQYYYGRDAFLRKHAITDDQVATHPQLTIAARLGFGQLLASVRRASKETFAEFDISNGVWADIFPDVLGAPDSRDIVTKFSYEPDYGQPLTVSDPRFTASADPEFLEATSYADSLTRYEYTGPPGDSNRLLARILRPTPTGPDGTTLGPVVEQFTAYDLRGRLLEHVNPSGTVTRFMYFGLADPPILEGRLQKTVVDALGLSLTTVYEPDVFGRVQAVQSPRSIGAPPGSFVTRQTYNALDQLVDTTSSLPFAFVTKNFYDPTGHVSRIERDAVDDAGVDIPNAPEVRTSAFDSQGNLLRETLGGVDHSTDLITRHAYDASDQRILTILPAGNRIRRYYSERMLPTYVTRGEQTKDVSTVRMSYNGDGQLRAMVSALGRRTSLTLDSFGRTVAIRDPLGNQVRRTYDKSGNLIVERTFERQTDGSYALVDRSEADYDFLNRVIRRGRNLFDAPIPAISLDSDFVLPPGPGRLLVTQFFYDANGRLRRVVDPMGHDSQMDYDAVGRLIRSTDSVGTRVEQHYDAEGNVVRRDIRELVRDKQTGLPVSEEVFSSTATYDELNRQSSATDSLGNRSTIFYDSRSNVIKRVDPLGNVRRSAYDIYGRCVTETSELTLTGLGNGQPIPPAITMFEYDANGNLIGMDDPLARKTTQWFDALDRRRALVYPDQTEARTEYDRDSNVLSTRDANGIICSYSTDDIGRVIRIDVDASGRVPGLRIEGFSFAAFDFDALGRLRRDENDFVVRELTLNSLGWVITERVQYQTPLAPFALPVTLARTFNDAGATTSLTYPSGRSLSIDRDNANQLTGITMGSLGQGYPGNPNANLPMPIATFRYSGSRCVEERFGNGAGAITSYDGARRRIELSHQILGVPFASIQQLWDGAGSVRVRNDVLPGATSGERYSSDSRYWVTAIEATNAFPRFNPAAFAPVSVLPPDPLPNRQAAIDSLISSAAASQGTFTLAYDLAGNRTQENAPGQPPLLYGVNALDEYVAVGGVVPTFDLAGNLTNDRERDYVYDALNRLVRVVDRASGANLASFFHDASGRRAIVLSAETVRQLLSDGLNVIEEYTDGVLSAQFVHADAPDTPLQIAAEGSEHWYHLDGTRSVRFLTDTAGVVATGYQYSAFGIAAPTAGPYNPLRFASRPFDETIGSYDFRTRQYDPQLGRFLQRDLAGNVDGTNLYTFAANNPVSAIDPLGTDPRSSAGDPFEWPPLDSFSGSTGAYGDADLSSLVESGRGSNEPTIPARDFWDSYWSLMDPPAIVLPAITIRARQSTAGESNSGYRNIYELPVSTTEISPPVRPSKIPPGLIPLPREPRVGVESTEPEEPLSWTAFVVSAFATSRAIDLATAVLDRKDLLRIPTSGGAVAASLIAGALGLIGLGSPEKDQQPSLLSIAPKVVGQVGGLTNSFLTIYGALESTSVWLPPLSLIIGISPLALEAGRTRANDEIKQRTSATSPFRPPYF